MARHPLASLVVTADDICYSILDIEDGVRLGHVEAAASNSSTVISRRYEHKSVVMTTILAFSDWPTMFRVVS